MTINSKFLVDLGMLMFFSVFSITALAEGTCFDRYTNRNNWLFKCRKYGSWSNIRSKSA